MACKRLTVKEYLDLPSEKKAKSFAKESDCNCCEASGDCSFTENAQCNGQAEAWAQCSNYNCGENDFQAAECLEGVPEALEAQGWKVLIKDYQCCECGASGGEEDGTQTLNVYACCEGELDGLVANFIYVPRKESDPCQWCSGLSGVEAEVKDGQPVWGIQRCNPLPETCIGRCQCTWYWYDENLGEGAWEGAYGWYGNNTCGSCGYDNRCNNCYHPSFDGTSNGQEAQTFCEP